MHSFLEAIEAVRSHCVWREIEDVPLLPAAGRFLAEDALAQSDSPRFKNSAVDGFAVRSIDVASPPCTLIVGEKILAGSFPCSELESGRAARIFTGAPLPEGADAVVMQEDCEWDLQAVTVTRTAKTGDNVRLQGEEVRKGDLLLKRGKRLSPPAIGLLAADGRRDVRVYSLPAVGVLATGNELVAPGAAIEPGQIYDSNSFSLVAALVSAQIRRVERQTVSDEPAKLRAGIERMLEDSQAVITCGGVSVGDFDLVKDVLAEVGVEPVLWGVSLRPGKPFYFGKLADKVVFGLPGNPVSALVCFQLFVKPALLLMMGCDPDPFAFERAELDDDLEGGAGRDEFVRANTYQREGIVRVRPQPGRGSHMLNALAEANCLLRIPADRDRLHAGEQVEITYLNW